MLGRLNELGTLLQWKCTQLYVFLHVKLVNKLNAQIYHVLVHN